MKKLFYPAIFHKAEEGGFWITFPDLPECITEGDDMEEAYNMAVDALGLTLTDRIKSKEELPKAPDNGLLRFLHWKNQHSVQSQNLPFWQWEH